MSKNVVVISTSLSVFCGGVNAPGDIQGNDKLTAAYEMGKNV